VFAVPLDTVAPRKTMTPAPWRRRWRAAERAVMNWEATIVLIGNMNFARGRFSVGVPFAYSLGCGPMALKTMSTRSSAAITWSKWVSTAFSSSASSSAASAAPPPSTIRSASALTDSPVRPERYRRAPWRANSSATAPPTSPPAPRMTAILSCKRDPFKAPVVDTASSFDFDLMVVR
jgi:hypothetical protein